MGGITVDAKSEAAGHRYFLRLGAKRKKIEKLILMGAPVGEIIQASAKMHKICEVTHKKTNKILQVGKLA